MKTKKLLYILALIIFTQANLNAQWLNIYTYNNAALYAIDCINEDTIFVAGYNSTILRTFDKGQTWQTIDPGFEMQSRDINFPEEQTGYITGPSRRIAKTTDCGENWELIVTDTNFTLREVLFLNPDTGWIIGFHMSELTGIVLKTTNGGIDWNYFYTDYELYDIEMTSYLSGFIGIKNHSWVDDDYGFLKTEDEGDTWNLSNPGMDFITNISFIDANVGYCLGLQGPDGGILKTIDGGETWSFIIDGIGGNSINRLQFINEQTGFYAGWEVMFDDGIISRTDDGGDTWTDQIEGRFWDIAMINADTGYALTWDGKIYKTINGGIPVGISEPKIKPSNFITISPNPLTERSVVKIDPVIINKNGKLTFSLYDQSGRKLKNIVTNQCQ